MLDPFTFEDIFKMERQILAERQAREAVWMERMPRNVSVGTVGTLRRRIARALLLLADRLDPRAVVSVSHVPAGPALNGTYHHA
jgi:hypothetical protein